MKGIADTGFLVAYLNTKDQHHRWALEIEDAAALPLLTCEPVLVETAYLLRDVGAVLHLVESRFLRLDFDLKQHAAQLKALAAQFADQRPDLCDLCVVRMSELFRHHQVLTTDRRDFTVYRRNQRELIPLILPPE